MRGVIGGILLAIGMLVAGLSGLCSLVFFLTEVTSPYTSTSDLISYLLMFGGIPLAIGLGMLFLGRYLIKTKDLT
jgi:phosphate starvation-inducible membrane PsiE